MDSNKYFATLPIEEIASELIKRVDNYDQYCLTSGKYNLWRKSHRAYYSQLEDAGQINRAGDQGEFHTIRVGHYRSFVQNIKNILAENTPSFDCKAINSDVKSQAQAILGTSLVDVYMRQNDVESHIKQSLEDALKYGEGFVAGSWETTKGEVYSVAENGAEIREGDAEYENYTPNNVIRDFSKNSPYNHNWYILRGRRNKFDLAAKYPELSEKILNSSCDLDNPLYSINLLKDYDTDDCPYFIFYHAKTPAVPDGRIVIFIDDATVLLDGPLPYDEMPIYRLAPGNEDESIFGYTVAYDLLPICQAMDALYSTLLSNNLSFGVQSIVSPRGSNVGVTELATGLNLIEYDPKAGPPTPLQLTKSAPETYNFAELLERLAQTISGIQGVTRSNAQDLKLSGSAYALLASLSVQAANDLEKSYIKLMENVATGLISMLQTYASTPRMSLIAGIANRSYMKEWKGSDLAGIKRVTVDLGSAMSKTIAGRLELAQTLMQNGLIKDPQTFLSVLNTGRLEPAIEDAQAEILLIRSENESLSRGQSVMAAIVDHHLQHINHHKAVLNSVEARRDPEVMKATLAHIQEHIDMLMNPANAQLLLALGQQPMPSLNPPVPNTTPISEAVAGAEPAMPSMPNAPKNTPPELAAIISEQKNPRIQ